MSTEEREFAATWPGFPRLAGDARLWIELAPELLAREEAITETRARLPHLLRATAECLAPDEHGMPWEAEVLALGHEQSVLADLLLKHARAALLCARVTGRGSRELIVALPEPGCADYALRKWARKLPREVAFEPLVREWQFFDSHLMPGPEEWRWLDAGQWVAVLLEGGQTSSQMAFGFDAGLADALVRALLDRGHVQTGPSSTAVELPPLPAAVVEEVTRVELLAQSHGVQLSTWGGGD